MPIYWVQGGTGDSSISSTNDTTPWCSTLPSTWFDYTSTTGATTVTATGSSILYLNGTGDLMGLWQQSALGQWEDNQFVAQFPAVPEPQPRRRVRPVERTSQETLDRVTRERRERELLAAQRAANYSRSYAERTEVLRRQSPAYLAEVAAAEALAREQRERAAAETAARTERTRLANRRAMELLLSHLTNEQRDTLERNSWFVVRGGQSGRRYRIDGRSYAGNVHLLREQALAVTPPIQGVVPPDTVEAAYCGHCDYTIPLGDQLLAQKIMLEADEAGYIALANRRAAA